MPVRAQKFGADQLTNWYSSNRQIWVNVALTEITFLFLFNFAELELDWIWEKNWRMEKTKNKYSIIVPTYNERLNIALLVYLVFKHLR